MAAALASGVRTILELAEAVVQARPEPQLRLISLEDERIKREAFKTLLPLYTVKAAAGHFGNGEAVDPEGWVEADGVGRIDEGMFVCRAVGRSMEPSIRDGDYVVFRARPAVNPFQRGNTACVRLPVVKRRDGRFDKGTTS